MAVIGKIRRNSSLLLIVIGGALMAFILTDLFSSRSSVFQEDMENIGSIDGKKIKGVDFNRRYDEEIENFKVREKQTEVPAFIQGQIREQIWNQYISEIVLGEQLDRMGIVVSSEELADMTYGDNPHDQVKTAFTNPETGQFNKADVINFLKTMENDETGKTKQQWLVFERAMKKERRATKYYNMIKKGLYATEAEAANKYKEQNKRISFRYIVKRYADVPDSSVTVAESDIRNYYNDNKSKFEEKKSRKIDYAIFRVLPSSEDSADVKSWVDETHKEFKITKDDSAFVNANSDREFDFRFYSKSSKDIKFDTSLFSKDSVGYCSDPFVYGEFWKMEKISRIKMAPDSVKARHILLSIEEDNEEEVKLTADSLKKSLEEGADFGALAKELSVDPGSKEDGGDLGWFKEGFMIPVINDGCFNAELNDVMIIKSAFGLHIIEVTEKSPIVKKLQVAIVQRSIDASRETIDAAFTASNDFSIRAESGESFDDLIGEYNATRNTMDIRETDNTIPELESSRGAIRWAYEAELNTVSEALEYGGSFVVIKVLEIHEDGVAPFDRVRDEAELGAIKDKKAEKFMEEMNGYTNIDDAAANLSLTVDQASNVVFESYSIPNIGREPQLLGKVFTMSQDDLSVPIKGENGVYIVHIGSVDDVQEGIDLTTTRNQLSQNRESRVDFEAFEALKKKVEIEDNRYRFY